MPWSSKGWRPLRTSCRAISCWTCRSESAQVTEWCFHVCAVHLMCVFAACALRAVCVLCAICACAVLVLVNRWIGFVRVGS